MNIWQSPSCMRRGSSGYGSLSTGSPIEEMSEISGASHPKEEIAGADALKKCADSESGQSIPSQQTQEVRRSLRKRKRAPLHEEQCGSGETFSTALPTRTNGNKNNRKVVKLKDEKLDLECEWRDCTHSTNNLENFVRHVSLHIPDVDIRVNDAQEGVYACLWRSCAFESADSNEMVRHINFHSYHTKIKSIGSNILQRLRLPVCKLGDTRRNRVPVFPHAFECSWDSCGQIFNNSQKYFNHVQTHLSYHSCGNYVRGRIQCEWSGCRSVISSVSKLAEHVRSHTQEKLVGCPVCGGRFANRTKFIDHCMRQVSSEFKGHQCLHCFSCYPTKRLMRDHARRHINRYKCAFCDMTCRSPSTLSTHIRYRHLESKPFKCKFCKYTAKTMNDINQHMKRHRSDPLYHCEEEGCDFSCRSICGLHRHRNRCHLEIDEPLYCCNICDSRFQRGSLLTRHLRSKHNIRWPSGHCRFKYERDKDGFFRLQTARHEDLNTNQEVMEPRSCITPSLPSSCQTALDDEGDSLKQGAEGDSILISLMQLDDGGNVVLINEMETGLLSALPLGNVKIIQNESEIN